MLNKIKNLPTSKKIIYSLCLVGLILLIIYIICSLTYTYKGTEHIAPTALSPLVFELNNFEIRWYALCVVGGALLLSVYGYYRYLKPAKLDLDTTLSGVTFGLISGILGARLYYVIFNHEMIDFSQNFFNVFVQIISPANGGLAIHGGIYGAAIFIIIFCKVKHLKFIEIIEIVMPVFMLAQVVGRWGNFFNQEAFGPLVNGYTNNPLTTEQLISQRETLRHLLVPDFVINNMYIKARGMTAGYYHPTFFYEGCSNLIIALAYIEIRKYCKKVYAGDGVLVYMMGYGFVRFFIEILRQDPLTFTLFGHTFKVAIVTSIAFFVVGLLLLILRRVFKFHLVPCNSYLYGNGTIWKDGYPKPAAQRKKGIWLTSPEEKKIIVFDCDGTILNTYKLIEKATCQVFDEMIPDYQYTMDEIHAFFGPLVDDSFSKYVKSEDLEKVLARYRELCTLYQKEYVNAYPGIKELLEKLRAANYTIVILSNKITSAIKEGLEVSGISNLIDEIYGAEKLTEVKPSPAGIYQVIEDNYVDKALIVGDSKYDIESCNNAKERFPKIRSVGVTWCVTNASEFSDAKADYIIDYPEQLLKVVKEYEKL